MPLVALRTNAQVADPDRTALLLECSRTIARSTGKPEAYVMTILDPPAAMTMAGTAGPACFVDVRGVGPFTPSQTASISEALCKLLSNRLGVPSSRIYLNFTGFDGSMWGFDGSTFG